MAKKTSRPSRATHPSNTPATPLHKSIQLYGINGSPLQNGFEFANKENAGIGQALRFGALSPAIDRGTTQPLANGFEFANDENVVTPSGCQPPPVINIRGFPVPPSLRPRTQRKIEKNARDLARHPKIGASLARAIKLIL
jgi:hypothetical protein